MNPETNDLPPSHSILFASLPLIRRLADKYAPHGGRDDFQQELSCRLLGALLRGVSNPTAWLCTVARNLAIDGARAVPSGVRRFELHEIPEPEEQSPNPLDLAARSEVIEKLRARARTPRDRDVLQHLLATECPADRPPVSSTHRSRVLRLIRRLRSGFGDSAA